MFSPNVIVSLDYPDSRVALNLVDRLDPSCCHLKIGKILFTHAGPALIETLQNKGYKIFLDLKFHDIPHTVAGACATVASLGVWMMNVHASGGKVMLEAAKNALEQFNDRPLLLAVTVLTSMEESELNAIGVLGGVDSQVARLAELSCDYVDGLVCSAWEAKRLRETWGKNLVLVTPGIRLSNTTTDDQKRIMTPIQAVAAGSDYLVIGRPILNSVDPLATLQAINQELATANSG